MEREILIIDDDQICNLITNILVSSKFPQQEIHLFPNGQEALEHLASNPHQPYLILLDLNMPVMNGWEFLEAINLRQSFPDLDIYVVSSSVNTEDQELALKHPLVRDYFVKPLTLAHLDSVGIRFESSEAEV